MSGKSCAGITAEENRQFDTRKPRTPKRKFKEWKYLSGPDFDVISYK